MWTRVHFRAGKKVEREQGRFEYLAGMHKTGADGAMRNDVEFGDLVFRVEMEGNKMLF